MIIHLTYVLPASLFYAAAAVYTAAVVLGCHWSLLPLLLLGLRTLTLGFGWVSSCIRWSHGHWP